MDDILASIRRILDEEGTRATTPADAPFTPPAEVPAVAGPPASEGVLDLDPSMILPEPDVAAPGPVPPPPTSAEPLPIPAPAPRPARPTTLADLDDIHAPLPVPMPTPAATAPPRPPASFPATPPPAPSFPAPSSPAPSSLVAPAAAAAAAFSVGALMRTLASERTTATTRGGPTIEDLVREEIRPLLKEWLDTHLPSLVERLVRAEIERVVSRTG